MWEGFLKYKFNFFIRNKLIQYVCLCVCLCVHVINSIDAEEAFNCHEKNYQQTNLVLSNLIKGIYEKPTADILLNGKRLKFLPQRQVCLLLPFQFSILLELVSAIGQVKGIKSMILERGKN